MVTVYKGFNLLLGGPGRAARQAYGFAVEEGLGAAACHSATRLRPGAMHWPPSA